MSSKTDVEWANKVLLAGEGTAEEIERASNTPGANITLFWEGMARRQKEEKAREQRRRRK